MGLIHNQTFRLLDDSDSTSYPPGLYRVLFDEPSMKRTVCVCIQRDDAPKTETSGPTILNQKKPRMKKPPPTLVGEPLWMNRDELEKREKTGTLKPFEIEREAIYYFPISESKHQEIFQRRCTAMESFLNPHKLTEGILLHHGLGGLVREAMATHGVSRSFVYIQWSILCRLGISRISLLPRKDRCGAPGVLRPCDPGGRKKPGRKSAEQRRDAIDEVLPESVQPGMSSEWRACILAADKRIRAPKPSMRTRVTRILDDEFVMRYRQVGNELVPIPPDRGEYPTRRQIVRVLRHDIPFQQRLLERTTLGHFKRSLRGLSARNWQGVAGPGHTWAIDSTLADIYLRSSINRAWIVGRPIVYVVVDVWSTAVVGFYVCLTGPSWNTAKIALFNSTVNPLLVGELWGYQPVLSLSPCPTLCHQLLCDRGEYLSKAASQTALKIDLDMAYTPPYRPDLRGIIEVLHRIAKDKQYLFAPGALNARRVEFELRKSRPSESVMTTRAYVQFLYEVFTGYNLGADRSNRLDAHMFAGGVFPSPAGLWRWGHEVGLGLRQAIPQDDLITTFLDSDTARVGKSFVNYVGNDYSCDIEEASHWTTIARNQGGWDIPIFRYPGSISRIWTPNTHGNGLLDLRISDQAITSAEATYDEVADVKALKLAASGDTEHARYVQGLLSRNNAKSIIDRETKLTKEAIDRDTGSSPSMAEARIMEAAANGGGRSSERKIEEVLRDEQMEAYEEMMRDILHSEDGKDGNHG